jgi:magnesium chelatase family protein
MVQRVSTVAFEGIEARAVDVQVQVAPGLPAFKIAYNNFPFIIQVVA